MDSTAFYLNQPEPKRSCLLALRRIILGYDTHISETVKYGMPCFCYGKKALCYLWTDKKSGEPYILMVEGNRLGHHALETGSRARMKIYRVNPAEDIDLETIESILEEAVKLYQGDRLKG